VVSAYFTSGAEYVIWAVAGSVEVVWGAKALLSFKQVPSH